MKYRSRRKRILTKEEIQEHRRKDKNYKSRKSYELKQSELFFAEYDKICKKYGCFVQSFYGSSISKQKRGETIYTIKSHLSSLKHKLKIA